MKLHPLLNPNSPHYETEDGKVAIEEMEKVTNICKMIGFCDCSIFKYTFRKGRKGEKVDDLFKIDTYYAYKYELEELLTMGVSADTSVAKGWEITGKQWAYRLNGQGL